jgi:hypothetical protein
MMPGQAGLAEEVEALKTVLGAMEGLSNAGQSFVLNTALQRLGLAAASPPAVSPPVNQQTTAAQQAMVPVVPQQVVLQMSAKDFLDKKNPGSDMHRVACLAYYLTHLRSTAKFKTKDIEALNTEARWDQFPDAAKAVQNATSVGKLLTPVGGGSKQLSAYGEKVVNALPDRDAVSKLRADRRTNRRKRKARRSSAKEK